MGVVTGRRSAAFEAALDDLSRAERGGALRALRDGAARGGPFAALCAAVAVEVHLAGLREDEALRSLEAGYAAASGAVADDGDGFPSMTGRAASFNPATGSWSPLPADTDDTAAGSLP